MFRDFDATKTQLLELADVINKFKSEAVQLRLVELLLGSRQAATLPPAAAASDAPPTHKSRNKKRKQKSAPPNVEGETKPKKKSAGGVGPAAILEQAIAAGFFKQGRTIGDICEHSANDFARRIKPNEISGKLGRMVRIKTLTRAKNEDGQFVYTSK